MNFTHPQLNRKTLGNIIIVISISSLLWMYFPIALYLMKGSTSTAQNLSQSVESDTIEIPKINAFARLSFNIDPWNSSAYEPALDKGVAHAKGSALPGEEGTSYLFAHSALPIWRMTHTNTPFLFLDNLSYDDVITITRNNQKYIYKVMNKKEVWPNEVSYLIDKTPGVDLILQTCTPIGTAIKRLLVFARRVV